MAGIAQSVPLGGGGPGDRIPVGDRFSVTAQTGPGTHPVSYTNEYRVCPGDKKTGA